MCSVARHATRRVTRKWYCSIYGEVLGFLELSSSTAAISTPFLFDKFVRTLLSFNVALSSSCLSSFHPGMALASLVSRLGGAGIFIFGPFRPGISVAVVICWAAPRLWMNGHLRPPARLNPLIGEGILCICRYSLTTITSLVSDVLTVSAYTLLPD